MNPIAIVSGRINEFLTLHPRAKMSTRSGVRMSAEFERIDALPRRVWDDATASSLAAELTAILRRPQGTQSLRLIQAIALYELVAYGGLLGPVRVGAGKTLISFLAPIVLGAKRPLLLLPAKLIPKTRRDLIAAMSHWKVATNIQIISYEWLSTYRAARYLFETTPDLIICDEAHRIRSTKATRTRRFAKYTKERRPAVVALSGTLIRKRLFDWAHIGEATLGDGSPCPRKRGEVEHWGNALDHGGTLAAGVLERWQAPGDEDHRDAYRRRIIETPGVVATTDGLPGVGLIAESWQPEIPTAMRDALEELYATWTLPDGFTVLDPLAFYQASRQLALGCFYRWKVQPPQKWRDVRREWGAFVRHASRYLRPGGRELDSEKMVALACVRGEIPSEQYHEWRAIKDTFTPEIEHVWITDSVVKQLIAEASREKAPPAIVWIESVAVGLACHVLGLPYYGAEGKTPDRKRSILDADPSKPLAASINACGEGLNLQPWSRNLISSPISDAVKWEQMLGRTHREGQEADDVRLQVAMVSKAHSESWAKAIDHARYLESITGQQQKLLAATIVDDRLSEAFND
jgi:hypothetical protein